MNEAVALLSVLHLLLKVYLLNKFSRSTKFCLNLNFHHPSEMSL
jgi:hypothetical protein